MDSEKIYGGERGTLTYRTQVNAVTCIMMTDKYLPGGIDE